MTCLLCGTRGFLSYNKQDSEKMERNLCTIFPDIVQCRQCVDVGDDQRTPDQTIDRCQGDPASAPGKYNTRHQTRGRGGFCISVTLFPSPYFLYLYCCEMETMDRQETRSQHNPALSNMMRGPFSLMWIHSPAGQQRNQSTMKRDL